MLPQWTCISSLSDLSQRYLLGLRLGPTSPCPSTVHMESYSASVFCVSMRCRAVTHGTASSPNRIFATTTKICTRSLDRTTARAVRLPLESHAVLRAVDYLQILCIDAGEPSADCFSIVLFRGWSIRQVSCYTLLGRFQLPWPRPCCLDEPTPFRF